MDEEYMILCLVLIVQTAVSESEFACLPTTIRGSTGPFYEEMGYVATFEAADQACRDKGANLLTMLSADDDFDIANQMSSWISAKIRKWTHVSLNIGLGYEAWATGEPSLTGSSSVAALVEESGIKLYSKPVSDQYNVICMTPRLVGCVANQVWDERCYFVPADADGSVSFSDAKELCESESSTLTGVFSPKHLTWLSETFSVPFWTGYQYNESSDVFYWSSGSPMVNTNLPLSQPLSGSGDCIYLSLLGKWRRSACTDQRLFVCVLQVPYDGKDCKTNNGECICFWTNSSSTKTFRSAMEFCQDTGGTLFYPKDAIVPAYMELTVPLSPQSYWVGFSEGYTPGVFRGADGTAITWANWHTFHPEEGENNNCVYKLSYYLYTDPCHSTKSFYCQSKPDHQDCDTSNGCLRATADHWDVSDHVDTYYDGSLEVTYTHVDSLEACWDHCVMYIEFVCVVVTYNSSSKTCMMGSNFSGNWNTGTSSLSRNRTWRPLDSDSYCIEEPNVSSMTSARSAMQICIAYKMGWKVPVVQDDNMLAKIRAVTSSVVWVSARDAEVIGLPSLSSTALKRQYRTFDGTAYIPFSAWDPSGEPAIGSFTYAKCVVYTGSVWGTAPCGDTHNVVCLGMIESMCNDAPDIENGNKTVNTILKEVVYICHDDYYMPTLALENRTITCDCNMHSYLSTLEDCIAIQCSTYPVDTNTSTMVTFEGRFVGNTVLYTCRPSYELVGSEARQYNITCTRIPNTYTATWSEHPATDAVNCSENLNIDYASFASYGDNKFGDVASVTCQDSYRIFNTTTNTINTTCVVDQSVLVIEWCWVPPCEAIFCSEEPPDVNQSTKVTTGNRTNSVTTYTCDDLYKILDEATNIRNATCLYDNTFQGYWSGIPVCEPIKCQAPLTVTNGFIVDNPPSYSPGEETVYECNRPYIVYDSGTKISGTLQFRKTCEVNQTMFTASWVGNYTCDVAKCDIPVDLGNITVGGYSLDIGGQAEYTCDINYYINSTRSKSINYTCTSGSDRTDPKWLIAEECIVVTCDVDPITTTKYLSQNGTAIGDVRRHSCQIGRIVLNSQPSRTTLTFTCELNSDQVGATWITSEYCTDVHCAEPGQIVNSQLIVFDTRVGDNANYSCALNYKISGANSTYALTTCQLDSSNTTATWTTLSCEAVLCDRPPDIDKSTMETHGFNGGNSTSYKCVTNYKVVGQAVTDMNSTCQLNTDMVTANWSIPTGCEAVRCPSPPIVTKANLIDGSKTFIGEQATYSCDAGFIIRVAVTPSNMFTIDCVLASNRIEGIWSEPAAPCEPQITTTPPPYTTTAYNGPLIRQCDNPPLVVGTTAYSDNVFIFTDATYSVDTAHEFKEGGSSRTTVCAQGGKWKPKVKKPRRKLCPKLPYIPGASKNTEEHYVGLQVSVRCKDPRGKLENGLSFVITKCTVVKKWTFVPKCCKVKRCGPFPIVEHSRLKSFNNSLGGQTVITCNTSYRFADGTKRKSFHCLPHLEWESARPCYLEVCPSLRVPANGTVSTDLAMEDTAVNVSCLLGFFFPDRSQIKQITCNASFQWSGSVQDCEVVRCRAPPIITNGNMTEVDTIYNTSITYTCDDNYRLEYGYKQLTIRCQANSEWTYETLSCDVGRCSPLPRILNAEPDTNLALNGTVVVYTCDKGHVFNTLRTEAPAYCNGISWNITQTNCTKVTCPLLEMQHASWTNMAHEYGGVVEFSCEEGYLYENNITGSMECQANSRWSGDARGCLPIDCGLPPDVHFAAHNMVKEYGYGTTVLYNCMRDYWFRRDVTYMPITCTQYGTWSREPNHCIPITCPVLPVWDDLESNTTDNSVGTWVNVSCSRGGHHIDLFAVSFCTDAGYWEPPVDRCLTMKLLKLIPRPEEAEGSSSIGAIVMGCVGALMAAIIVSDASYIIQAIKGIKVKHSGQGPKHIGKFSRRK